MNKTIRKFISIVAVLCLIVTQLIVFAEGSGNEETLSLSEKYELEIGNKWVRSTSDYNAYNITGSAATSVTFDGASSKLSSAAGILYKFPMPKPGAGQKIEKYIIRISICDYSTVDVLKFPGEYSDVTSFRNNAEPYKSVIANYATNSAVDKDENGNKLIVREASGINYIGQEVSRVFIDITSYVNELYNAGQRDHFYVIAGSVSSTRRMLANAVYSANIRDEFVQASFHSFAPADELQLVEAIPEDGEETLTSSPISVRFNNCIENATGMLNGKNAECEVSGATVSVEAKLMQYENYTLTIDATDVFGNSKQITTVFSTLGAVQSPKLKDGEAYYITASKDPFVPTTTKHNINKSNSNAMIYRIPVSEFEDGMILDSFKFNPMINTWSSSIYPSLYKLEGDDWEFTEDKNEDGELLRFSDISNLLDDANLVCKIPDDRKISTFESEMFLHEYNIISYANECIARGEEYVDIIMTANATVNLYGFITENWASKYAPTYEYSLVEPEIKATDVKIVLNGTTLDELSFRLLTDICDASDRIVVRNFETDEDVEAIFTYDETNRIITLSEPVSLADGETFSVVITKDTEDKFGNINDDDVVITGFYAGETPVDVFAPEESYTLDLDVDSADSAMRIFFMDSSVAGLSVNVTVIHEDGDSVYDEIFEVDRYGRIKPEPFILSDSGIYTVLIVPQNAPACYRKDFAYYSQQYKEELWNILAVNGSETEISDNWNDIACIYDLSNDYIGLIDDMDLFGEKIVARRDFSHEFLNSESIAFYKELAEELAFCTLVEEASSENVLKNLMDEEYDILSAVDAKIIKEWTDAVESEYASKTLRSFIDAHVSIFRYEDITDTMKTALVVYNTEKLLETISKVEHISEIDEIIDNEEAIALLGIENLIGKYRKLSDKNSVNKAIKKRFDSAEKFAEAFENAIEKAVEDDGNKDKPVTKKPTSSGGGNSGSGAFVTASVPAHKDPFNPFNDIENVSWAKEHIINLYNQGIINGKTYDTFAPDDLITREEIAKLICTMINLKDYDDSYSFDDVDSNAWYAPYVMAAASNSIANGIGNGKFGVGLCATREDIAVMIVNVLKYKKVAISDEDSDFKDNSEISDYAKSAVAFLTSKGIVKGDEKGFFNPRANATRAEVAVMISRTTDTFLTEVN